MISYDDAFISHLGNLSRAIGHDVGKYEYILSSNQLLKSYYESKKDLPYPMRKEVKRDRYIYNADGLQKDLTDLVNDVLESEEKRISDIVSDDIVNMVYEKINGVVGAASGSNKSTSKTYSMIGAMAARSIINGISAIMDDIRNPD